MASVAATTAVPAGSRVTVDVAGSIPAWQTDANFRESFGNQIRMQGLNVETIAINSGYGLSSRDYTAQVTLTTNVPSKVSTITAQIISAAENAGSYTPQATIPSLGQASQPKLTQGTVEKTVGQIVHAVGNAAEGIGKAPEELFSTTKLIVLGIVVLAAFIAFGPNLRGVGRNISVG